MGGYGSRFGIELVRVRELEVLSFVFILFLLCLPFVRWSVRWLTQFVCIGKVKIVVSGFTFRSTRGKSERFENAMIFIHCFERLNNKDEAGKLAQVIVRY